MTITDIVSRNKNKVDLYLDGQIAFVLYKGDLRKYSLAKDEEMPSEVYEELMSEVLPSRVKNRAYGLLQGKDYTEKQIREKLSSDGYPFALIDETVNRLKAERFIDDRRFAENHIYWKASGRSLNRMKADLLRKGVKEEVIREIYEKMLSEGEIDPEEEAVLKLLRKKNPDLTVLTYEEKEKLTAGFMRKGFSYDAIKRAYACFTENRDV